MKCIYCLEDKPSTCFKKTEHVLPQSFGKFRNNFTLNKIVCDSCNEFFGNHLEILLGRDTLEGIERFVHKVKKPKEFKSIGKKSRISVKVNDGPFKGAYAYQEYSENEGNIIIKPLPQIGFKDINAEYVYFLLDDIPDKAYLENNFNLKIPKSIAILGCPFDLAQECLAKKGIMFNFEGELSPEVDSLGWDCEVTVQIDQIIFRAIGKIAFNYLASYAGSKFVLDSSFHPIRRYIRFGEMQSYPSVIIIDKPILGDEPIEGRRRLGHLIILDWSLSKTSYVSRVSLFNYSTYSVVLAKDYKGEVYRRGNFFNIADCEIYALLPEDKNRTA
jgi:hypothetical protein